MPDRAAVVKIYPFWISDPQIEKLIWDLNEAFRDRRKSISYDRNVGPSVSLPIRPEHIQLYVPGINSENGSVYVQNIALDKAVVSLLINSCLIALVSAMRNPDTIEHESRRLDDIRALNGESRRRAFEGRLTTVRWFDELVARELAEAFVAVTGQKPTIGGYKRPSDQSERAGEPARNIKSPFTVFALYLVRIAGIKRLGAGGVTVSVLRKGMAPYWRSKRQVEGGEVEDLAHSAVIPADPSPPTRRGRPRKGDEPAKLRVETPFETEICDAEDLATINWEMYEVD